MNIKPAITATRPRHQVLSGSATPAVSESSAKGEHDTIGGESYEPSTWNRLTGAALGALGKAPGDGFLLGFAAAHIGAAGCIATALLSHSEGTALSVLFGSIAIGALGGGIYGAYTGAVDGWHAGKYPEQWSKPL